LKVEVYGGQDAGKTTSAQHSAHEHKTPQPPQPAPVILNRRERRKLKDQPGAAAAVVGQTVKPVSAPTALTTAMIHQQMAEMKRCVRIVMFI
jgi:hypothetical protein